MVIFSSFFYHSTFSSICWAGGWFGSSMCYWTSSPSWDGPSSIYTSCWSASYYMLSTCGLAPVGAVPTLFWFTNFCKKVKLILDYLPGSKAQVACSSLGVMKPCSR